MRRCHTFFPEGEGGGGGGGRGQLFNLSVLLRVYKYIFLTLSQYKLYNLNTIMNITNPELLLHVSFPSNKLLKLY
jgi:hypothetical protein